MGSKPSSPKYNVQAAYTDYNVKAPYTNYNVEPTAMGQETPQAMQVPTYDMNAANSQQSNINSIAGQQLYANMNSPLGGYSISQDPETGQLTINKQLSSASSAAQNAQMDALNGYTGDPTLGAQAYYNSQMAYLQPKLDRQTTRTQSALTNRGIALGSSAWNEATGDVYDMQNQTLSNLSNQALNSGQQYQSNILGQANTLGSQVIDPTLVQGQGGAGYNTNAYKNYYNSLANQANADYQNQLLRYQNAYQDMMNNYNNELNAYNNAVQNEQNRYQNEINAYNNAVQNEQNRYNNDLNAYQAALQNYQTKMANNGANKQLLGGIGTVGGAVVGGWLGGWVNPAGYIGGATIGNKLGESMGTAIDNG